MIIKDKNIGVDFKPYIIAELSANHGGSLTRAKESIKAAAKTGVSAVKIQTYTPDTMTINCDKPDFFIKEEYGLAHKFMIFIKVPILLMNGMQNYLILRNKMILLSLHLSMKLLLIC